MCNFIKSELKWRSMLTLCKRVSNHDRKLPSPHRTFDRDINSYSTRKNTKIGNRINNCCMPTSTLVGLFSLFILYKNISYYLTVFIAVISSLRCKLHGSGRVVVAKDAKMFLYLVEDVCAYGRDLM